MPSPSFLECPRPPGLIIGGTGSHAGKTALTLALLCALRRRGMVLAAAKVGPDYIDTAFHAAMTGQPVANLDTWMCREAAPLSRQQGSRLQGLGLRRVFQRMQDHGRRVKADLLVVEGAMGLFDGGHDGAGSTAQLSAQFGLPVLLTLNASGMGQSAAAVAEGFLRYCPSWTTRSWQFLGMGCTHVGSDQHARILRQALTPVAKNL
ncbi:MAG: AAA family ATPase, partial [Desulfovibrio sp.]|nr:AAA family ATPase [Desulfovibrio sp.]